MENQPPRTYEFGPFRMDIAEHRLLRDGQVIPMTPKNFDVLRVLVENAGRLVRKEELLKKVWPDSFVEEANLNRSVSVLRKALGDRVDGVSYIETAPKLGYRFVGAIKPSKEDEDKDLNTVVKSIVADAATSYSERLRKPSKLAVGVVLALSLTVLALSGVFAPGSDGGSRETTHYKLTSSGKVGLPAITADGGRVAYISYDSPQRRVVVQERAGSTPRTVFVAPELGHLKWSPDGSELLVWARGDGLDGLYIVSRTGGSVRKITSNPVTAAAWSPDGSKVAVVTSKIKLLDRMGIPQGEIRLPGVERWIFDLDWSPISDRLLWVHDDKKGNVSVSTIRPNGTGHRELMKGVPGIWSARWAPTGDAIYFMRQQNQTTSLYKLSLDSTRTEGRVPQALLTGLDAETTFGVSNDGKYLVYAQAPLSSNLWSIRLRDKGGLETRQLTQGTSLVERPSISPDGKFVVYSQGSLNSTNLFRIPIEGGSPKQLTFRDSLNLGAVWSSDGSAIAFTSNEGGILQVWMVPSGGGFPQRITGLEVSDNHSLSWSPGRFILYQELGNRNYYMVDPAAGEKPLLQTKKGAMFSAIYSPDGKRIAAAWYPNRNPGLYIFEPGKPERLITPGGMPLLMAWAADGNSVYALDGKRAAHRGSLTPTGETSTETKILRYPLAGSAPQTLFELPFDEIGGMSITPDGKTVICAVYSSTSDVWISENFDRTIPPSEHRIAGTAGSLP